MVEWWSGRHIFWSSWSGIFLIPGIWKRGIKSWLAINEFLGIPIKTDELVNNPYHSIPVGSANFNGTYPVAGSVCPAIAFHHNTRRFRIVGSDDFFFPIILQRSISGGLNNYLSQSIISNLNRFWRLRLRKKASGYHRRMRSWLSWGPAPYIKGVVVV